MSVWECMRAGAGWGINIFYYICVAVVLIGLGKLTCLYFYSVFFLRIIKAAQCIGWKLWYSL